MGGIVGLTIRFDQDRTYRGSCWTNVLPFGLCAVDFYKSIEESKAHVKAWLDSILANREVNPDVESLWGDWDKLAPVEYGLIVVDYVTETLVSAQGYMDFDGIHCYGDLISEEKFRALDAAGLITDVRQEERPEWKTAAIKLPFKHFIDGMERRCDADLQAWCQRNFGLSVEERKAWAKFRERFEPERTPWTDKAWIDMTGWDRVAAHAAMRKAFPIGCRVKIVASDAETESAYVGKTGTVADYEPIDKDSPPLIGVVFDEPHGKRKRDGFYEDEIVRLERHEQGFEDPRADPGRPRRPASAVPRPEAWRDRDRDVRRARGDARGAGRLHRRSAR